MDHHLILLWLNPFSLGVHREGLWFENYVSYLMVCLSAECAKKMTLAKFILTMGCSDYDINWKMFIYGWPFHLAIAQSFWPEDC